MATNADAPFGLKWHSGGQGAIITATVASGDSAVLGYGDPVQLASTTVGGEVTVTRASAGNGIYGIVIDPKPTGYNYTDSDRRRTASVRNTVQIQLVVPGSDQVFVIQSATGTNYSATMTDRYCDIVVADASSTTAQSNVEANLASLHATQGDLRVLGLAPSPDGRTNEAGQAHAKLLVQISNT